MQTNQTLSALVMEITPEIARSFLTHANPNNRPIRSAVHSYANDMRTGNWRLNGEPICFDQTGMLVNGHHRLTACVEAGVPFQSLVCRGVQETDTYDRGLNRSITDILKMSGITEENANSKRAIIVNILYLSYKINNRNYMNFAPTYASFLDICETFGESMNTAINCVPSGRSTPSIRTAPSYTAAWLHIMDGANPERIKEFFSVVKSGYQEAKEDSPAITLRNYLLTNKSNTTRGRAKSTVQTYNALRDYLRGVPRYRAYKEEYTLDAAEKYADNFVKIIKGEDKQ